MSRAYIVYVKTKHGGRLNGWSQTSLYHVEDAPDSHAAFLEAKRERMTAAFIESIVEARVFPVAKMPVLVT